VPVGLEFVTIVCFLGGLASISLALLGIVAPTLVRGRLLGVKNAFLDPQGALRRAASQLASWIAGRIPAASAGSVALFRIVFGSALLIVPLRRPVLAAWAAEPSNVVSAAHRLMLRILSMRHGSPRRWCMNPAGLEVQRLGFARSSVRRPH